MTEDLMSLQKMQVMSWVYLAFLTLSAYAFQSAFFSWSVFIGGLISIISFWVCHNDVTKFFQTLAIPSDNLEEKKKGKDKGKAGYILKFWIRIVIIGIVLLVLIKYKMVDIFGLIVGLSTVVLTVTITAVNVARRYFFSRRR